MAERLTYEQSCRILQEWGLLDEEAIPPMPAQMPRHDDDEPLGVGFFKSGLGEDEPGQLALMENMTLPRTFFGRSYIRQISFKNTDLSESRLCWNDFTEVDFTKSDLTGADLRATVYKNVLFVHANLSDTDLRHSLFEGCDFTGATMKGAKLKLEQAEPLNLSKQQREDINWQAEDGEELEGG